MKDILLIGAGLAAGYLLATHMAAAPAVKGIGAYSLPCTCASGGVRNCGDSTCSCCPDKQGVPGGRYNNLSYAKSANAFVG